MAKAWVGYVRVSSDEQAKSGTSLEQQKRAIEGWAIASERTLEAVIEDPGQSAKSLKRPGISHILKRVEAGEIAGIMVYRLDRLTRSLRDIIDLIELLTANDVALVSVSESIDTGTPMGRMIIHLIVAVAQWQREDIVERVTKGMHARKAEGAHTGGAPPRGLIAEAKTEGGAKFLAPCPETGGKVAELWPRALRGASLSQLAQWARAEMPRWKWYKQALDRLLRNPRYIGLLVDAETHAAVAARLGEAFGGAHDTAHRRKALLTSNPSGRAWPLKGVGRCAECGSHLHGVRSKGKMGVYYHYYRCLGRARGNGCKAKDLPAEPYERAIAEALIEHLAPSSPAWAALREAALQGQERIDVVSEQQRDATMRRDKAVADQDRLLDLYLAEGGGRDAIRRRLDELAEVIQAAESELAQLSAQASLGAMDQMQADQLIASAQQGLAGLADAAPEIQAQAFQQLISEVAVSRARDHIDLVIWPLGRLAEGRVYKTDTDGTGCGTVVNSGFGSFAGFSCVFGFCWR